MKMTVYAGGMRQAPLSWLMWFISVAVHLSGENRANLFSTYTSREWKSLEIRAFLIASDSHSSWQPANRVYVLESLEKIRSFSPGVEEKTTFLSLRGCRARAWVWLPWGGPWWEGVCAQLMLKPGHDQVSNVIGVDAWDLNTKHGCT